MRNHIWGDVIAIVAILSIVFLTALYYWFTLGK